MSPEERLKSLKNLLDNMRDEYGLLSIVDIVLNHTANNSEWIVDHPEATYNTDDCPHLYSAYLLDKALADFSDDFAHGRNKNDCPSAPYVSNEADLNRVVAIIRDKIIPSLRLAEFFMCDVERNVAMVREFLNKGIDQDSL